MLLIGGFNVVSKNIADSFLKVWDESMSEIAYADSKVKRRVPKLLLECSKRQLHNELIASPDDGG